MSDDASTHSDGVDVPPRPVDVLDTDRIQYQAMADLGDDEYAKLAQDIRDRGVLNPILVDENDTILDGHHREAIAEYYGLDGSRAPAYVRLADLDSDDEKLARAIKQNNIGRDTTDDVKRASVEGYIKSTWPRDDDGKILDKYETEDEVAEKLGVSQKTVNDAKESLRNSSTLTKIPNSRHHVREYYEDNPDASYLEIAREVGVDDKTVSKWVQADFEDVEDEPEQQPLNLLAFDDREADQQREVLDAASDDDADDDVREAAREQAERLASRETTPDEATAVVEQARTREDEEPDTTTPPLPDGTYRTLVIDPPWDMEKIERTERPQQGQYLDYPTMSVDELADLPVADLAADSGAHIFLWTTHKRLPDALDLFDAWGARYECLLTWVKPTGVAPFSWQYNTEHVLFGRFGAGSELDQRGLQLSFEAPVTQHSAKPDVFYDRVRDATARPRLEMFARTDRDGFDVWGDEVDGDVEAPEDGNVDVDQEVSVDGD